MKVKCLKDHPGQFTKGKIYESADSDFFYGRVVKDDTGSRNGWNIAFFEEVKEIEYEIY